MSSRSLSVPESNIQSSRVIVDRLNHDWELCRRELATWMSPSPNLDHVLQSVRFNPDLVLQGLISACQQGEPLAGRVIIQALIPKLILMSRTYPYPAVDHLVSALWIRIARYPLTQRPRSIAANLVLDTKKDVLAESKVQVVVPLSSQTSTDEDVSARAILARARSLGLATTESLGIMERVYLDGLPTMRVAELYAISPDAVRRRCSDTVQRLRTHRSLLVSLAQAA